VRRSTDLRQQLGCGDLLRGGHVLLEAPLRDERGGREGVPHVGLLLQERLHPLGEVQRVELGLQEYRSFTSWGMWASRPLDTFSDSRAEWDSCIEK
jgi:hypothetical protein